MLMGTAQSHASTDDQIDFKTGGTDRMVIDSAGKVGIGTTSPDGALTVQRAGDSDITFKHTDGSTKAFTKFTIAETTFKHGTVGGDSSAFFTNNTERMRINSSGNVGIGTTSPSQKLDVNGTINATAFATSPVLSAIAGLSFGAVGTFCFARRSNNTTAGTTYAGSQLRRAGLMTSGFNTNAYEYNYGSTLSGTWRSLGTADDTRNSNPCYTIYVRIS